MVQQDQTVHMTDITDQTPSPVAPSTAVWVRATVVDNVAVNQVNVSYSGDLGSGTHQPMTHIGGDVYQYQISAVGGAEGDSVSYTIYADDTNATPNEAQVSGTIQITAGGGPDVLERRLPTGLGP